MTESVLDERHARRRVRCVTWTRPRAAVSSSSSRSRGGRGGDSGAAAADGGEEERFALKIALRGKNDSHCRRLFNEKDVMVALKDSPWHTTLVNTYKSDTNLYMLLEYAPSLSVDQHIEAGRGLRRGGVPMVRFYTACVLAGLQHMHKVGKRWGRCRVPSSPLCRQERQAMPSPD